MAKDTILHGRQVERGLTGTDYVVMASNTVIGDPGMIEVTAGEGTRGMADATIVDRRHVIERLAKRRNTMAGVTTGRQDCGVSVVEESRQETLRVMA